MGDPFTMQNLCPRRTPRLSTARKRRSRNTAHHLPRSDLRHSSAARRGLTSARTTSPHTREAPAPNTSGA
eukprot:8559782-Pyramimonas_sp.AAC.1